MAKKIKRVVLLIILFSFFLWSDLCNSNHAMVIKIIKVYFITSTCKKTQPELYLNVQFSLMFHILLSF